MLHGDIETFKQVHRTLRQRRQKYIEDLIHLQETLSIPSVIAQNMSAEAQMAHSFGGKYRYGHINLQSKDSPDVGNVSNSSTSH